MLDTGLCWCSQKSLLGTKASLEKDLRLKEKMLNSKIYNILNIR